MLLVYLYIGVLTTSAQVFQVVRPSGNYAVRAWAGGGESEEEAAAEGSGAAPAPMSSGARLATHRGRPLLGLPSAKGWTNSKGVRPLFYNFFQMDDERRNIFSNGIPYLI